MTTDPHQPDARRGAAGSAARKKPRANPDQPASRTAPPRGAGARPPDDLPELELGPPPGPDFNPTQPREQMILPDAAPVYRCLNCGYPLAGTGSELRCSECGRSFARRTLRRLYSGEEEARFKAVLWFLVAGIFVKLLLIPPLLIVSQLATAGIVAWASTQAAQERQDGPSVYYGYAGLATAALMLITLFYSGPLGFYILDMIAGCLLLLTMLHDVEGRSLAGTIAGRGLGLVLLFSAPFLAAFCWHMEQSAGATPLKITLPEPFTNLFGFVIPYVAALGVWIVAWVTLQGIKRLLFQPLPGTDEE